MRSPFGRPRAIPLSSTIAIPTFSDASTPTKSLRFYENIVKYNRENIRYFLINHFIIIIDVTSLIFTYGFLNIIYRDYQPRSKDAFDKINGDFYRDKNIIVHNFAFYHSILTTSIPLC